MAGVSIAKPQDLISSINGNPATLTQFKGTQFLFGGAWAGSTFDINQTSGTNVIPGLSPFSARSETPGAVIPNIGVTQDFTAMGLPVTFGIGLVSTAGAGSSFRQNPASNGTNTYLSVLNVDSSIGVQLTDRLSLGTSFIMGTGFMDGPFVGTGGMTIAYGIRGVVGVDYKLTENTNLGFYYQSKEHFRFKDEARLYLANGLIDTSRDVRVDMPSNIGMGVSNTSLLDGRLLLAADVLYIQWRDADLFSSIYRNQWTMQLGTQYSINPRVRLRAGYAYAMNPISPHSATSVDGINLPGGTVAFDYLQAQFGVINQNRMSAGFGVSDVLPGIDFDAFAGGMFRASQQFGTTTDITVESYWIGFGLTWRFRRGDGGATWRKS
jgi:long-chain fatty acid transport protein